MAKRKRHGNDLQFSFDFSSLDFNFQEDEYGAEEELAEIPKLNALPVIYENAEKLVDCIDIQKDYFCFLSGAFIFGDFIEALCAKKVLKPEEIYITTLGMSQNNIDSLCNLVGYCKGKKKNLIVSHYFYGTERHKLVKYMMEVFKGKPIDVAVLQSHCKIVLIYSKKCNLAIIGSANLSSSNNVEQIQIMHDETLMAFCKKKLDHIMKRFTVYSGMEDIESPENNKKNTGYRAYDAIVEG